MGNYITWNFTNWVTVILMVSIGMAVIGTGAALIKTNLAKAA